MFKIFYRYPSPSTCWRFALQGQRVEGIIFGGQRANHLPLPMSAVAFLAGASISVPRSAVVTNIKSCELWPSSDVKCFSCFLHAFSGPEWLLLSFHFAPRKWPLPNMGWIPQMANSFDMGGSTEWTQQPLTKSITDCVSTVSLHANPPWCSTARRRLLLGLLFVLAQGALLGSVWHAHQLGEATS